MKLPQDPMILLSYVNTQLRDFYPSLEEFCRAAGIQPESITEKLKSIDYIYDEKENRFS